MPRQDAEGPDGGGDAVPLDPDVVAIASASRSAGQAPLHEVSPATARARVLAGNDLCASGPDLWSVSDAVVAGVPVRKYTPRSPRPGRTMVWAHGGGWVTGDLDYGDEVCRTLAAVAGCCVVSVDYRLAPEHPFPAALEDVQAVVDQVTATSDEIVAVGGDSAGGNLAAASSPGFAAKLAFQVLVYPVLDHDLTRPSYLRHAEAFPTGMAAMAWFWHHYAPDGVDRGSPYVSPLRLRDVAGLPRTHLVLAGHDPLNDEGAAFARRLSAAGVPVTVDEYAQLPHGFLRFTGAVASARQSLVDLGNAVSELFGEAE